ncbi:hypothetical protein M0805_001273 [Coniferiporia weirii]|nr:hypothetical protein M0805_001273 [Coniferiporia weirii]
MLIAMSPGHQPIHLPYAVDYTPYLTEISKHHEVEGAFAYIYKAKLYGKRVAIKVIKHKGPRDPTAEAKVFQKEYMLWHPLNHPNILSLKGICFFRSECIVPSFISRWQENGRITDFVSLRPDIEIFNMFEHITMGVSYLHDNGIIHGDLRGANILVSGSGRPLVTDFGIAKQDNGRGVEMSTAMNGNHRWMAHELFKGINEVLGEAVVVLRTKESDVWSLGMLFKEIMSGKIPYHEYWDHLVVLHINDGLMPQFPPARHQNWIRYDNVLQEICSRCWAKDPNDRPDMKNIISQLRESRPNLLPDGSVKRTRSPPTGNESRHPSAKLESTTAGPNYNQEDDTLTLSRIMGDLRLTPHRNEGRDSNLIVESPQGLEPSGIGHDNGREFSPRRTTTSAVLPPAPLPRTDRPLTPKDSPLPSPHAAQAVGERRKVDVNSPLDINRSPTREYTISPGVELDNFLAREGLKILFCVEYSHPTPYDEQTWIATCFFKGEEIARAVATKKTLAYVEAAKTALNKLRGVPQISQRHGYALRSNANPLDLSLLEEKFVANGASHMPIWECILSSEF